MSNVSPVIGAPNSFTAIDEQFVTSEVIDPSTTEQQASSMPVKKSIEMPMDMNKDKNSNDFTTIEKDKYEIPLQSAPRVDVTQTTTTTTTHPDNQVYSPGYFQRALDALRGRRNSESYSGHTTNKSSLEDTIHHQSVHAKSLGVVSVRELGMTQGSVDPIHNLEKYGGGQRTGSSRSVTTAPYNIYGSQHPSAVGRKGEERTDSIMEDLGRGYHNAMDILKHRLGLDKQQQSMSAPNTPQMQSTPVVDSAVPNFNQLADSRQDDRQMDHPKDSSSTLSTLTEKEFPLLI